MPIQYFCSGCGRPIEVDDEFAGRQAACPHCSHIAVVPIRSTYDAAAAVQARGVSVPPLPSESQAARPEGSAAPPEYPMPYSPAPRVQSPERERMAARLGSFSLAAGALVVPIFIWLVYSLMQLMVESGMMSLGSRPTQEQMQQFEKLVNQHPHLIIGNFVVMGLAVLGLALGIASLAQSTRGNWRGIVGSLISGAFVFCFCMGIVLQLLGGGF